MKINLNTIFKLLATMLVISLLLLFCSCGARKKDKTVTDETVKIELTDKSKTDKSEEVNSNVKVSETTTVNNQDQMTTVEEVIEPLDPYKEAVFTDAEGKKQVLNNSKKTTKTTLKNNNTKSENKKDSEVSVQSNKKESEQKDLQSKEETEKKASELHVKRDAWSVWNLIWLLVPVIGYLVWKNRLQIFKG